MLRRSILAVVCALVGCGADSDGAARSARSAEKESDVRAAARADPGAPGPYKAGFTSVVLVDESRPADGAPLASRPIPLYVWYPVDAENVTGSTGPAVYPIDMVPGGNAPDALSTDFEKYGIEPAYDAPSVSRDRPFPLVVFSPGWGGPPFMLASLGTRLASHGFVVAVPYHWGDQWAGWEPPWEHIAVANYNRPRDVSFVITALLARSATSGDLLHGAVDASRIAAGGWSLGGFAAMALAGGVDSGCDLANFDPFMPEGAQLAPEWTCVSTPPDPRVRAIVTMDGSGQFMRWAELARITVPSLVMGEEWGRFAADAANAPPADAAWMATFLARPHAAMSGHPNLRVEVMGANHQSFSDWCEDLFVLQDLGVMSAGDVEFLFPLICTGVGDSTEIHRVTAKYAIAFLKTTIAGDSGYRDLLTPGYALTREPLVELFQTEKRSPRAAVDDCVDLSCTSPMDFLYFAHQPGEGSTLLRGAKDPSSRPPVRRDAAP